MKLNMNKKRLIDIFIERFFFIIALSAILTILLIMFFLFKEGLPLFSKISITDFIFGTSWYPTSSNPRFGIFPLIIASFTVTLFASLLAIPLSLSIAVYLSEIASPKEKKFIKPTIELIASLPSVIIGFIGMVIVAPFLQNALGIDTGLNLFNASIMLAFMAIPTIATISEDMISSVPKSLKEASYALGATRLETIFHVTLPAALSGIWTAIILGISRIIGETMVVLMVSGGATLIPDSIFSPVRPLTSNIAAEMSEASVGGMHYQALFAIAIVLFIITFLFNILANFLTQKYKFLEN